MSDNGAMLTEVIGLIVGTVMECTLLMYLEISQFLRFSNVNNDVKKSNRYILDCKN